KELAFDKPYAAAPNRHRTPVAILVEGLGDDFSVDGNRPRWHIRAADFVAADGGNLFHQRHRWRQSSTCDHHQIDGRRRIDDGHLAAPRKSILKDIEGALPEAL